MTADGLLLVGHGSTSARSLAETHAIADLVAAAVPGVTVAVGFLELAEPAAGPVLDDLVGRGCTRVVVLPLMLLGAGHAKSDVPALVLEARQRHAAADIRLGNALGVGHDLVAVLGDAIVGLGGAGLPLLLIARGTSDPDANGDAAKVARLAAEWTGAAFVHTAFSGVTRPRVPDGLEVFARLGYERMAVAFWFLGDGVLVQRARAAIETFTARTGVDVVDAGYLGPDPRLVRSLVERYHQAAEGVAVVNCDLCAYRAPWPGLEARVAQPVGVGHSHLAADHRHSH